MDFSLAIDSESETIIIKATCLLNQNIRKKILSTSKIQLDINGFSKVLIDLTEAEFSPSEPMLGALELANYMCSIGIQPHVKFAFIYSDSKMHRLFFQNVAQLEGFNLRYFTNVNNARAWLG